MILTNYNLGHQATFIQRPYGENPLNFSPLMAAAEVAPPPPPTPATSIVLKIVSLRHPLLTCSLTFSPLLHYCRSMAKPPVTWVPNSFANLLP